MDGESGLGFELANAGCNLFLPGRVVYKKILFGRVGILPGSIYLKTPVLLVVGEPITRFTTLGHLIIVGGGIASDTLLLFPEISDLVFILVKGNRDIFLTVL